VNLSTAHSLERSKEVGVRKVIGATKMQLVRQFLAETFLMNAFGIIIGFVLFKLSLSRFSLLIGQNVTDLQTATWQFWLVMFAVFVCSTLLAGFLSCFYTFLFSTRSIFEIHRWFCWCKTKQEFLPQITRCIAILSRHYFDWRRNWFLPAAAIYEYT
jgi:ABC-type lipoprotein release transport system permease subunit